MSNRLTRLFDFQRFAHDARLEHLIREAESSAAQVLNDDALEFIAAAGEPEKRCPENSEIKEKRIK